ncbi:CheY-like chemotaxis protein [Sphingomonas sp. F9_3S_D5_B_2]
MWSHGSSTDDGDKVTVDPVLAGRKILIVEDSPVVGPFAADIVEALGGIPIGPAPTLAAARELIAAGGFDLALVDVHIRGERAFALCDSLAAQGVPFVLTSGYADWQVPERLAGCTRLQKPYGRDSVRDALRTALAS